MAVYTILVICRWLPFELHLCVRLSTRYFMYATLFNFQKKKSDRFKDLSECTWLLVVADRSSIVKPMWFILMHSLSKLNNHFLQTGLIASRLMWYENNWRERELWRWAREFIRSMIVVVDSKNACSDAGAVGKASLDMWSTSCLHLNFLGACGGGKWRVRKWLFRITFSLCCECC